LGVPDEAVVSKKDITPTDSVGMQQALSSNGDGFVFHDRAGPGPKEALITLDEIVSREGLLPVIGAGWVSPTTPRSRPASQASTTPPARKRVATSASPFGEPSRQSPGGYAGRGRRLDRAGLREHEPRVRAAGRRRGRTPQRSRRRHV
jgi:hypothetical protein